MTAQDIVGYIFSAIGVAAVVAAALPQGKPGTAWATARQVIDLLAANVANAKNHPQV